MSPRRLFWGRNYKHTHANAHRQHKDIQIHMQKIIYPQVRFETVSETLSSVSQQLVSDLNWSELWSSLASAHARKLVFALEKREMMSSYCFNREKASGCPPPSGAHQVLPVLRPWTSISPSESHERHVKGKYWDSPSPARGLTVWEVLNESV